MDHKLGVISPTLMCKYAVHSFTLWLSDKKKSAFQQIGAAYSSSVFSLMPTLDYLTTLKNQLIVPKQDTKQEGKQDAKRIQNRMQN